MPQTLSIELIHYMTCCANGQPAPLPDYSRYLFSGSLPSPIDRTEIEANYLTGQFDSSTIEGIYGVGVAGMVEVTISYIEAATVTTDTLFADTTSSASFWADINGWLQMNNFNEISYVALLDKWLINDVTNQTYIEIIPPLALRLLWDDIINAPVVDAASVSDWNTFFDLPTNGTPFTSVVVNGSEVQLIGGSGITLADSLFGNSGSELNLLEINDEAGCVIAAGYDVFGDDNGQGCGNLTTVVLPVITLAGDYCFNNCTSLATINLSALEVVGVNCFSSTGLTTISLPQLQTVSNNCFGGCLNLVTIDLPSCIELSVNNLNSNYAFADINHNTISLNINSVLTTCLYGEPHIDIITLAANNSLTLNGTYYAPFTGNTGDLTITFDNISNVPVVNPNNVNDWNNFFDLRPNSTPFSTVNVSGNSVTLYGGENIVLKQSLFSNNPYIISISDTGCVVFANQSCFPYCSNITSLNLINLKYVLNGLIDGAFNLISVNLPNLIYAVGFSNCPILTSINLPDVKYVDYACFVNSNSLTSINLPSCQNLGSTVGDDTVFLNIIGNTITLTVPSALMTCNGGNPDGDIQYLQANNTVTVITV